MFNILTCTYSCDNFWDFFLASPWRDYAVDPAPDPACRILDSFSCPSTDFSLQIPCDGLCWGFSFFQGSFDDPGQMSAWYPVRDSFDAPDFVVSLALETSVLDYDCVFLQLDCQFSSPSHYCFDYLPILCASSLSPSFSFPEFELLVLPPYPVIRNQKYHCSFLLNTV